MEYKKIIGSILILIVLCGGSFWAGSVGTGRRAQGMADRIGEIQGQLDDSLNIVDSLRSGIESLNRINAELESENIRLGNIVAELRDINKRLKDIIGGISDANSNTRQGITEAETGIESVAERIRKAIEENKKAESDNNS